MAKRVQTSKANDRTGNSDSNSGSRVYGMMPIFEKFYEEQSFRLDLQKKRSDEETSFLARQSFLTKIFERSIRHMHICIYT